jgi:hypothetical protein
MPSQPHGSSSIADSFAQRVDLTMNIAAAKSLSNVLYSVYDGQHHGGDTSLAYALLFTLALSILSITGSQYLVRVCHVRQDCHSKHGRPEQEDMAVYIVGRIRRVLAVQMSDLFIRSLQSEQAQPHLSALNTGWQASLYWYFVKIAGSTVFVFAMIYICRKLSVVTDNSSSSTLEIELGRVTIALQYMLAGSIGSVIVDNGQQLPELYVIVGVGCMAAIPSMGKSADHYYTLLTSVLCMVWANVVIQLTVNNSSIQGPVQQTPLHGVVMMTTDSNFMRVNVAGGMMRIVAITSITILIHAGVSMAPPNATHVTSLRGYTQWMLATTVIPALAASLFIRDYEQVLLLGVGVIILKIFMSRYELFIIFVPFMYIPRVH